jgi:hypothetical protein
MARRRKSPLVPGARAALDALSVRVRHEGPGGDAWDHREDERGTDPNLPDAASIWVERFRARMRAAVMREHKQGEVRDDP